MPDAPVSTNHRESFIEYYRPQGYKTIPGSSLLDLSVPMTFVMSAGLVQVETSARVHGGLADKKYALVQNCFRYFDLVNVGQSATHLSLFQMLGAFTFGPFSKRECVSQIWRLLTQVYGFQPDSLWVSYFAGGEVAGRLFAPDRESQLAWRDTGLPESQIVGLGAEHNFWKQSANVVGKEHTPKCGPNTEVFFDRGAQLACSPACRPGCRCGRFVEFLNTLFITLHLDEAANVVKPLAEPFTETVIGAERLAMLLQDAPSVFEIDEMRPLLEYVQANVTAHTLSLADRTNHERILADHVRALVFLTADGAPPPGRGGRARLMRKLVREMLTSQKMLGLADLKFMPSLVEVALCQYAHRQPALRQAQERVLCYIAAEQHLFEKTLRDGQRYLERLLRQRGNIDLSPQDVVDLEKFHGVPRLLVETMCCW